MPEWASTLLGVIVGGALTGLVTLVALRWQLEKNRRRSDEDALRERRERGSAAVAPVRELLLEANSDVLVALAGTPRADEASKELRERWRSLRDPLVVYGMAHPSREVQEVACRCAAAVARSLDESDWAARFVAEERADVEVVSREARTYYTAALDLADELVDLVRKEEARPGSTT
ncbi:MAG: hypothetical protein ACRDM0_15190 [Thermoleophilaceae bacterium]